MDRAEAEMTQRFSAHPALQDVRPVGDLHDILLERRHLSLMFTQVYDMLLDGVEDAKAKGVIRDIIREEYPRLGVNDGRSHREDVVVDMIATGLNRVEIVTHRPSVATAAVIAETLDFVFELLSSPKRSLLAVSFIRMWGEVLTALEYERLWYAGIGRFFKRTQDSVFYWYHFEHDRSRHGFVRNYADEPRGAATHSDQLTRCLAQIVRTEADADEVLRVDMRACSLKQHFYDQFD